MTGSTRFVCLALALGLCGCVLDKPLSDPKDAKLDERLLGRWVGVPTADNPDAGNSLLFVGRHEVEGNPRGIMEGLVVDYDPKRRKFLDPGSSRVSYFTRTTLGSVDVLNVFCVEAPDAPGDEPNTEIASLALENSYARWEKNAGRSAILYRYVLEGDLLKIYLADIKKLDDLAAAGDLKKSGDWINAASLAAYIEKKGADDLFVGDDEAVIYKRAK